jgi:hypothetical protein
MMDEVDNAGSVYGFLIEAVYTISLWLVASISIFVVAIQTSPLRL